MGHSTSSGQAVAKATYDDVLNAPDNKVAEILDGELHLTPRPTPRHAVGASALTGLLWGPFDRGLGGPGGWWILAEPELHLGEHVVVPDLAGWRRERMPAIPETAFFSLAPDWICEVLSPSTQRIDRALKLRIYAVAGVTHAWLLDPLQHTLEVLRRQDDTWVILHVHTGDATVRIEPFDALELELGLLWPEAASPAPR